MRTPSGSQAKPSSLSQQTDMVDWRRECLHGPGQGVRGSPAHPDDWRAGLEHALSSSRSAREVSALGREGALRRLSQPTKGTCS